MNHNRIVAESVLDQWVHGNAEKAKGVIVELVHRLVAASAPRPAERRFPLGDSIGQHGPDGHLITETGFPPFVPQGRSFWEIGTGKNARKKASSDYRSATESTPEAVRAQSTFVFVTPLSGRTDWEYTWKEGAQADWVKKQRRKKEWGDVQVIDGSQLIDWLYHFPAVEIWLASSIGLPAQQLLTPEQHWASLETIGYPPPLSPSVFLLNRGRAREKMDQLFSQSFIQLQLDTHFPEQMADFVAAYIASMSNENRVDAVGRCIITSGVDGWNAMINLQEPHVLVANFEIDEAVSGTKLLNAARRQGHSVIYKGEPGGVPHPFQASLPNPRSYQIAEALENAGYTKERARNLAQRSDGNLSFLLRCLQNLSLMPEWAQTTGAAELAIAELLGEWREDSETDKAVVEILSKKVYGEWIEGIRGDIAQRPATPLILRNGAWKITSRYEGWLALGPRIYDEHLDRLKKVAVRVLTERDPQFELSAEKRHAASVYHKVLGHSLVLRRGLANALALLGSHPKALTSCSFGKAEIIATLSVREILGNADWVLWGSLDHLLALLAEAAPTEFLNAVENALNQNPCPFDMLFEQERSGILGRNYMSGLLWALETLAWDPEYLTRVVIILGELAVRDPGGNWTNRPANSLSTILLPWFPQTCAPIEKRRAAVEILVHEQPEVAWKLLLKLLPKSHQITQGSYKPIWREMIKDDWTEGVTDHDYWRQTDTYAELAINMVKNDLQKLIEIIERLDDLPLAAFKQLTVYLASDAITAMPPCDKLALWTELTDLITKHRKYHDAKWAMNEEQLDKIASIAQKLKPDSPDFFHRRLFSERDFYFLKEEGNYREQLKELSDRRQKAIQEIYQIGSAKTVLNFAEEVESPWRVGIAFGAIADKEADRAILPELLETENKSQKQFAGGFIWGRFRTLGWKWVDGISTSDWNPGQIGTFLACLPFTPDTWQRSIQLLGEDESLYWIRTGVNPFEAENGLDSAVENLIEYGRPYAAIRCLHKMIGDKQPLNNKQAVRALISAINSSEAPQVINRYDVIDVIKTLQNDPGTDPNDLFQIEWAYFPLLDSDREAYPKLLENQLSKDPAFFCEIIRTVFRPKADGQPVEELTDRQKLFGTYAYELLYNWRIPPGAQEDGSLDGEALINWLEYAKKTFAKSSYMNIAMNMIGQVLIHAPSDPSGLWIHHSAATALNNKDAKKMRDGFTMALYNSRGTHGFTSGREERQFAEKYSKQADEVEKHGYHRLATSLRELSDSYKTDSERESTEDPFEDW